MAHSWIRLGVCAGALSLAAPAAAARWVGYEQWNWVDMDSVARNGSRVSFLIYRGGDAPVGDGANGFVERGGIDCATRGLFWWEGGQLVPVPENYELDDGSIAPTHIAETAPLFRMMCR